MISLPQLKPLQLRRPSQHLLQTHTAHILLNSNIILLRHQHCHQDSRNTSMFLLNRNTSIRNNFTNLSNHHIQDLHHRSISHTHHRQYKDKDTRNMGSLPM
jgi:tRNA isopentenyl-2-thiomethyl-A-37 hydroxylase MiaE